VLAADAPDIDILAILLGPYALLSLVWTSKYDHIGPMKSARVSELKASLSRYLARVKRGEEVVVTERGRPIAKLVPVSADALGDDPRLSALERAGVIRRGAQPLPANFWRRSRPADPDAQALAFLIAERDAGP